MDGVEFLRTVWPESGPYLLATPAVTVKDNKTINYFKHFKFDDAESAHAAAEYAATVEGEDVYFAIGSPTTVEFNQYGGVQAGTRKQSNIRELRCFFLDIDVKDSPDAYPTLAEAVAELKKFVASRNLPKPIVVYSGGGLHV